MEFGVDLSARVTVGIPFHNAAGTLLAAIRSVLAQTFTDWELLLIDDGSTDGSGDLARSVQDPRVSLVSLPENRGLVWALNEFARTARGEYLARMDADDLMHPRRLERQVAYLDEHPDVSLVSSAAYIIDAADRPIGMRALTAPDTRPAALLKRNLIIHPSVLGRTAWFRSNPYDTAYHRAEDHELWCRTCQTTRFGHIGEPLLFVRDYPTANVKKYAASLRSDRKIYRTYGPAYAGRIATAGLLAEGYLKPWIYALMTHLTQESRLLQGRNLPISTQQAATAAGVLEALRSTSTVK